MTITTKFEIGDTVWYLKDGLPTRNIVYKIDISVKLDFSRKIEVIANYRLMVGSWYEDFFESNLYPTKSALVHSLV